MLYQDSEFSSDVTMNTGQMFSLCAMNEDRLLSYEFNLFERSSQMLGATEKAGLPQLSLVTGTETAVI